MGFVLKSIPLNKIDLSPVNPRTDAEHSDLEGLAATIQTEGIVQPPSVIQTRNGRYEVLLGERRIRAARMAGLEQVDCLVTERLDPLDAHRARLVENLHRAPLNPLDEALALRVSWLLANAEALGLHKQVQALMAQQQPLGETLPQLEGLLNKNGFKPTAPPVTWDTVLNGLGVAMTPDRRRKLLRILAIPQDVQEQLRQLPVTEAAARALVNLEEDDLRKVVDAIQDNPDLARRARRIASAIRQHGYGVDEALAEARGEIVEMPPAGAGEQAQPPQAAFAGDQAAIDAVMRFLETANQVTAALEAVRAAAPQTLDIPEPWRGYFQNTLEMILETIQGE